jgi:hypothetical protein
MLGHHAKTKWPQWWSTDESQPSAVDAVAEAVKFLISGGNIRESAGESRDA